LSFDIVKLRDYILGNNGFIIPSLVYLYLGASAQTLFTMMTKDDPNKEKLESTLLIVGLVVITGLICFLAQLSKRELNKMLEHPPVVNEQRGSDNPSQKYGSLD
jgi:uncharacterized membrane protein YdjX (TVP38/TMEM64 family)